MKASKAKPRKRSKRPTEAEQRIRVELLDRLKKGLSPEEFQRVTDVLLAPRGHARNRS